VNFTALLRPARIVDFSLGIWILGGLAIGYSEVSNAGWTPAITAAL